MEMPVLVYIALIILSGLGFGRLAKLVKLPNVTGYLVGGLIIGPFCLKVIPFEMIEHFQIVSQMALGFIAFNIGSEFKISYLKKVGTVPIKIAFAEAFGASLVVFVALALLGFDVEIALLLGAIAAATAPAATVMVVNQYKAKGPVTETLLSVVAIDDAAALILFGFASAVVKMINSPGEASLGKALLAPIIEIVGSLVMGFVLAIGFAWLTKYFKKQSNRLIITCAFVFLGAGIAQMLSLSDLLLCMAMGATLINISSATNEIMRQVDSCTPPLFLMFFVISGAELDLRILPQIGVIGIVYIIARVIGKVGGAAVGASLAHASDSIKKYIGLTLVPQAGVAIGLSLIAAQTMPEHGGTIRAVVLCATLVYELTGPAITKEALIKAGEITLD